MSRSFQSVLCAALTVFALSAVAQDKAPAAAPAVKSVNIQDVKPDASDAPGYAEQNNAERGKVQPGSTKALVAPLYAVASFLVPSICAFSPQAVRAATLSTMSDMRFIISSLLRLLQVLDLLA